MKKTALVLGSMLVSFSAHAETVEVICSPDKANQTKTVQVREGDVITMTAAGNPTTGYSWKSKDGLKGTFSSQNDGRLGAGGLYSFEIETEKSLHGKTLTFEYARAWETKKPAASCKIKVKVQG